MCVCLFRAAASAAAFCATSLPVTERRVSSMVLFSLREQVFVFTTASASQHSQAGETTVPGIVYMHMLNNVRLSVRGCELSREASNYNRNTYICIHI